MGESHKRHVKQKKTQKSHRVLIAYDSVYVRYKRSKLICALRSQHCRYLREKEYSEGAQRGFLGGYSLICVLATWMCSVCENLSSCILTIKAIAVCVCILIKKLKKKSFPSLLFHSPHR